jgi:RNA polymerase sigma factor (sigma-70 family)
VDGFIEAHAALILRLARAYAKAGDPVDPHDVAQEVLVALLRAERSGSFEPARLENVEGYLRVVVRNAVLRARARGVRSGRPGLERDVAEGAEIASVAPSPEDVTERALDARRTLESLKRRLRPRDAIAFALLVEDGMSIDEVARTLETTSNNVYQMRHRILTAARELLGKEDAAAMLDLPDGDAP